MACATVINYTCWEMAAATLLMNCDASNYASNSSSRFSGTRSNNLVDSADNFNDRNFCNVSCLNTGLSNSVTTYYVVFLPAPSRLSHIAFVLSLRSVPSTTVFALGSSTPISLAPASNSLRKFRISPLSNSRSHWIFIVRHQL